MHLSLQEKLNAAIPQVEHRAARLNHHVAEAARATSAAHANLAAAAGAVRQEAEALAVRLERLHRSLAAVEQEAQRCLDGG